MPPLAASTFPDYLREEILLHPENRKFPPFDLTRLLGTVFEPTRGCRVCILIDFDEPAPLIKDFAFLDQPGFPVQKNAHRHFYLGLKNGALAQLGMTGGEIYAYRTTHGSNLDLQDDVWDTAGNHLSLDRDIYSRYDLILCISTFSATAPLTAKAREFNFRGATLHGLNDIILNSGLAVDYHQVSEDAERLRLALTRADSIEIDFALEDGRILTATLDLGRQEAQKSHGLCHGTTPDIANLPAGEVYFVPVSAHGRFPMKYEDGTLGELGFGTQVLPVSGADIQDEKVLGTCHLATGRDDHLSGDILPGMFKRHENSTHDDILFAPHKTPNFNIRQVRMNRGGQQEILIENFRPSRYLMDALAAGR